ncbi:YciI family protein [Mesorhizobium sp. BAC0120]|uniref:YciI family protein n=1 Tax=Mesorhizobium sp. BAC0120 TaxID=3090670 RepID=UPI00298CC9FF|nr:YciI family protein [Mesorhizobium sp. BAC0120]MDW6022266.1 YciI family protein [Mesorhizobium sp. BAC0120]
MQILGMLKSDPETDANPPPFDPVLMARMGDFVEEAAKAGVLVATNGLHPSAAGKRIKLDRGKVTITDGPFTESKELVSSFALFEVTSMDEAVHWTTRFLEILGKGECELRPVFETSDFPDDLLAPEEVTQEKATRQQMALNAAKR